MKTKQFWNIMTMLVLIFGAAFVFSSCHKDDDEPSTLSLSTQRLEFTALGGERSFTVASNTGWNINGAKSWCYISITQGNGTKDVNVEVEKNTTKEERSCNLTISTTDGMLNQTIKIIQDAAETTLTVSPSDITFSGESGLKDEFTITTNGHWTISGKPEWLNVPTSGDGNTNCKIETLSANDTDEDRIADLQISADGKKANLKVTQRGLRVKCSITPTNVVALYDEICFDLKATGNINTFKYLIHSEHDINRLTDKEIEAELEEVEANKFVDDYIIFPDSYYSEGSYYYLQPNTTYYICTIAYDVNGKPGALKKTPIKTLKYLDYDNDAFVSFSDEAYGTGGFQFTCTKEGYCNTYHLIYGNLPTAYSEHPRVLYAFEINYYIKNHKKHWFAENWGLKIETEYPNNHTFTYATSTLSQLPLLVAMAWGVFKDGSVSSDMTGFLYDISQNENAPNRNIRAKNNKPSHEGRMILRSEDNKRKMSLLK